MLFYVMQRDPLVAYGEFYTKQDAQAYAQREGGGQVLELAWRDAGNCDADAIWFDGDWEDPFIIGPFYDLAEAAEFGGGEGIAVPVEMPYGERPIGIRPTGGKLIFFESLGMSTAQHTIVVSDGSILLHEENDGHDLMQHGRQVKERDVTLEELRQDYPHLVRGTEFLLALVEGRTPPSTKAE